jgi:hypothetical protein
MNLQTLAAIVFAIATAGVVIFQLALAAGAPWGAYAMGGAFPGRFSPRMRVAAAVQGFILAAVALIVLANAGVIEIALVASLPWLIWAVVALCAVAVVLNAASRSAGERRLWVPVTLVLLASSLVVAIASGWT